MLKFLGDGGAFDIKRGNTNAYYKTNDTLFLFDCGSNAFFKIMENNLLEKVKHIKIFITHLHSDHSAGLASLCDYLVVLNEDKSAGVEFDIYYPNFENIETILRLMHIGKISEHLHTPEESEYCKGVFLQKHCNNAYGYLLEIDGKKIYYSGDTSEINSDALQLLLDDKIDYFYHEASNRQTPYHCYLPDLAKAIPEEYRKKVYLMHINDSMIDDIKKLKFNLCVVKE